MSSNPVPDEAQPDLHQAIAEAVSELAEQKGSEGKLPEPPVSPEQVRIPGQRTMRNVHTLNSKLDGGDLAACLAVITQGDDVYTFFFLTCRRAGEDRWRPVASVGGERKPEVEPFLGKLHGPRSYVAIGSLNVIPDGGRIRIELQDGTNFEDQAVDGCCIAVAPITFPPDTGELSTIRYINPDGTERGSERVQA